jgi:hypothetical protein
MIEKAHIIYPYPTYTFNNTNIQSAKLLKDQTHPQNKKAKPSNFFPFIKSFAFCTPQKYRLPQAT